MPDTREQLIETAIRPFDENAELKLAAAGLLEKTVPEFPESADEMVRRWDALDRKKSWLNWRTIFLALAFLVAGVLITRGSIHLFQQRNAFGLLTGGGMMVPSIPPPSPARKGLTPEQEIIFRVDSGEAGKVRSATALLALDPENPVYFAKSVVAYLSEKRKLPADMLENAGRIDPGNSWYLYLAASEAADRSVEKKSRTAAEKASKAIPGWDVKDRAKLDEAITLLHRARLLPVCEDHKAAMARLQIPLLAQDTSAQRMGAYGYLASMTAVDLIGLRKLSEAIAAKAALLTAEGDAEGLRELAADTDAMILKMLDGEPSTLVACLVYKVTIAVTSQALANAADRLGLENEATRYRKIHSESERIRDTGKRRALVVDGLEFKMKASLVSGLTIPAVYRQVEHPPEISDKELEPGRMMDHELLSMVCAIAAFFLLGIFLTLAWAFRFRLGKPVRLLARRAELQLRAVDWAWIIGGGVLLPFLFVFSVSRLTPLGAREISVVGMMFMVPVAHFFALSLLCVIVPVLIARWRLGKGVGGLGLSWGRSWMGWVSVLATVAYVLLIGTVVPFRSLDSPAAVTTLLLLPKWWLLVVAGRALTGDAGWLLKSGTVARVLVPTLLCAMFLMACLIPALQAAEQYWFERDHLMMLDPEFPGFGTYEYKVSVQMLKELRGLLDS